MGATQSNTANTVNQLEGQTPKYSNIFEVRTEHHLHYIVGTVLVILLIIVICVFRKRIGRKIRTWLAGKHPVLPTTRETTSANPNDVINCYGLQHHPLWKSSAPMFTQNEDFKPSNPTHSGAISSSNRTGGHITT